MEYWGKDTALRKEERALFVEERFSIVSLVFMFTLWVAGMVIFLSMVSDSCSA